MRFFGLILTATTLTAPFSFAADPLPPSWVQVTPKAPWKARDSQGEVVFNDRLWVMGGWYDSFSSPPRDVWSTADGKNWDLVTDKAGWKHSDLPMTVVHKDKMWLMGGWYNGRLPDHSASNEVWSSSDGKDWTQVTAKAAWTPRISGGLVSFKGKIWLLGGIEDYYFGTKKSLKNDVWSSEDGKDWKQVSANAPWSARAYHQAVVHDGKMWVIAGGNYVPKAEFVNDVWSSEDGVIWTKATDKAPWAARIWFSAVTYRDHIWVLGGWSKPTGNLGDVWYSKDGKDWKQYKPETTWKSRHEHSAYVWKDKIWVAGGHASPLNSEVWSLDVPKEWFK